MEVNGASVASVASVHMKWVSGSREMGISIVGDVIVGMQRIFKQEQAFEQ
jgi:hypothetical protein